MKAIKNLFLLGLIGSNKMKEFLKLRRERRKLKELDFKIKQANLQQFIGKKVKISKQYADWFVSNGDEVGIPYEEIDYIRKKPKGEIVDARYDGFEDGFVFTLKLDNGLKQRVGIEDFNIVDEK